MYYGSNEKLEVGACYDAGKGEQFVIFENVQQCIKFIDYNSIPKYNFYEVEPQDYRIFVLGGGRYTTQSIKVIKEL